MFGLLNLKHVRRLAAQGRTVHVPESVGAAMKEALVLPEEYCLVATDRLRRGKGKH